MTLADDETIITAYATHESGPGWSNEPVWFIVRDGRGNLREECLQPDEQSYEMRLLFRIAAAVHDQFKRAVKEAAWWQSVKPCE